MVEGKTERDPKVLAKLTDSRILSIFLSKVLISTSCNLTASDFSLSSLEMVISRVSASCFMIIIFSLTELATNSELKQSKRDSRLEEEEEEESTAADAEAAPGRDRPASSRRRSNSSFFSSINA